MRSWDRERLEGVGLVLCAALSTAVMGVLAKKAFEQGSEAGSLLAVRYLLSAVLLGIPLLAVRAYPFRSRRAHALVIAIGVGMVIGGTFEFSALDRLPLSIVIVILFTSPLWILLHTRIVRRQRLGAERQLAFASVLVGIVLLVGLKLGDYDGLGLLFAFGSSVVWATILVLVGEAGEVEGFSPGAAIAAGAVVAGVLALCLHPGAPSAELGDPDRTWLVVGVGVTAALGFGLLALGMTNQHVFDVSVVAATEPLFAAALSALFLGERLTAWQLLGVALVAVGVVLIARADQSLPGEAAPRSEAALRRL